MITTISHIPPMPMKFNPHLLSSPIFKYDAEYLLKIADFLKKKVNSSEFHKFPATIVKLKIQHQQFMELYERAKIKEREVKEKAFVKANAPFYRPRLANKNDQRVFERLDDRRKTSEHDRRNSNLSKV